MYGQQYFDESASNIKWLKMRFACLANFLFVVAGGKFVRCYDEVIKTQNDHFSLFGFQPFTD